MLTGQFRVKVIYFHSNLGFCSVLIGIINMYVRRHTGG